MLVIRKDQLACLEIVAFEDFVAFSMDHLRMEFGLKVPADMENLRQFVLKHVGVARQYDITEEEYVTCYLELCVKFPLLCETPMPIWADEILSYPDRSSVHKLEMLCEAFESNYS